MPHQNSYLVGFESESKLLAAEKAYRGTDCCVIYHMRALMEADDMLQLGNACVRELTLQLANNFLCVYIGRKQPPTRWC